MIALPHNLTQTHELQQAIQQFLAAQSSLQVKMCTLKLRELLRQGSPLCSLLHLLNTATDRPTLQLSIVLASKIIKSAYSKLDEPVRDAVRESLIQRLDALPKDPQLERALASLIGKVLEVYPFSEWMSLMQFMKGIADKDPRRFLVVMTEIVRLLPPPVLQLTELLLECAQTPEVSEEALNCIEATVEAHQANIDKELIRKLVTNYDPNYHADNQNVKLLQILTLSAKKSNKLDPKIASWICKSFIANNGLSPRVRSCGIDFIFVASKNQDKLLSKKNFIKEIVEAACSACTESAGPPSKDSELLKEVALFLIESRITKVHNKNAFGVLFDTVSALICSNQEDEMCTGFTVMTGISESCTEKLRLKLAKPIMTDFIPRGINHPESKVRTAAIRCLCYFCEFLYPDILDYYELIIDALMRQMSGLEAEHKEVALAALDILCDKLESEQMIGYLPSLVSALITTIVDGNSTSKLKELSLNVLGTLVLTAQLKFLPHLQSVMDVSLPLFELPHLTAQDKLVHASNITLQGKLLGEFCGDKSPIRTQYFQTYVLPYLERIYVLLGQSKEERQIAEASFVYFYKIAQAIGSEFSVVFPKIIDRVLEVCEAEIDIDSQPQQQEDALSLDSSVEQMDEEAQVIKLSVAEIDMKAAALHTLGNMANVCFGLLSPYMERVQKILEEEGAFCFENMREQVVECRRKIATGLVKFHFGGKLPAYKQGLPCLERYPPAVEEYLQKRLYPIFVDVMCNDCSTDVRMSACDAIESLSKDLGPIFVDANLPNLCDSIRHILQQETLKHDVVQEEEDEPDDDERQELLVDSVGDLIQRLAKVFLGSFNYHFEMISTYSLRVVPILLQYLNPDLDQIEKCVGLVGCIAKCFKHLPDQISRYHEELLQKFGVLHALNHERLNRNVVYCVGMMFEKAPSVMQPYLTDCINMIQIIKKNSAAPATIENALASICRIVLAVAAPVNLEGLLNEIIARMPFVADLHENPTVYRFFLSILAKNPQFLEPYYPLVKKWLELHLAQPSTYHIRPQLEQQLKEFHAFVSKRTNF